MRYAYISHPDDKQYIIIHRALVTLKDNIISLDYYLSGVKRTCPLTFTSKEGILLNIVRTMGSDIDYNMFIPETNPYFSYEVLSQAFPYNSDELDEAAKVVKRKLYETFQRVQREFKKYKGTTL